jgi:chromosome segregation ATPase
MNSELSRCELEQYFDEMLAEQKAGLSVCPLQLANADAAFTAAANRENKACFEAELAKVATALDAAINGLETAHKAMRQNLHAHDALTAQRKKLEANLTAKKLRFRQLNSDYEKAEELLSQCH